MSYEKIHGKKPPKMTLKTKLFFLFFFALLFSPQGVLATNSLRIVATDTISGYSSAIRTSLGNPRDRVIFRIEKPDGSLIELEGKADEAGVAKIDFLGYHTKEVGIYHVTAYVGDTQFSDTFEVFPDVTSPIHSQVMAIKDSAEANGADTIKIRVTLRDRNGNPISNHFVDLISSRASENIDPLGNGATNAFGEIYFYVTSSEDGISYFSALDRNAGVTLEDRAKAVFFRSRTDQTSSYQADLFHTDSFFSDNKNTQTIDDSNDEQGLGFIGYDPPEEAGVLHHFEIEIEPSEGDEVHIGRDYNLTIRAVDADGIVVTNYEGTVVLASTKGVSLPGGGAGNSGNMVFSAKNMGVVTASLAIRFSEVGEQTITAYELDLDTGGVTNIIGKKTITVVESCTNGNCDPEGKDPSGPEKDIVIATPSGGTTLGTTVPIAGTASLSGEVRAFVDNIALATFPVEKNGSFAGTISVLTTGGHVLVVKDSANPEKVSDPISFNVRNTPPALLDFSVTPTGTFSPGEVASVTVVSQANLQEVKISLTGDSVDTRSFSLLESESNPGNYKSSFAVPAESGTYILSVRLKDSFGLISEPNITKSVVVQKEASTPIPQNVVAEGGDREIKFSWSISSEEESSVSKFEIFRGNDEEDMKKVSETLGTAREKIFSNLENDTMYFLRIRAIDKEGKEGEFSKTVSATPEGADIIIPPDIPSLSLQAEAGDGKVKLTWGDPLQKTDRFVVRFGIESEKYREQFSVDGETRSVIVDDLVNGIPYYFSLQPFDKDGIFTGDKYEEKSAQPLFSGVRPPIHGAPPINPPPVLERENGTEEVAGKNGPEHIFLLFIGLSFALAMFSFQRSLVLFRVE
ncbi:Ig-like domain-containing protein [Candidatus Peregrinibacteria bacterium]|nr:MAG: Ig-like domain-containing protein [Candidatus Peregrinibacteria bacterium]